METGCLHLKTVPSALSVWRFWCIFCCMICLSYPWLCLKSSRNSFWDSFVSPTHNRTSPPWKMFNFSHHSFNRTGKVESRHQYNGDVQLYVTLGRQSSVLEMGKEINGCENFLYNCEDLNPCKNIAWPHGCITLALLGREKAETGASRSRILWLYHCWTIFNILIFHHFGETLWPLFPKMFLLAFSLWVHTIGR